MPHKVEDSNGNTICICADKFFESLEKIPKDKFAKYAKGIVEGEDWVDFKSPEGHIFRMRIDKTIWENEKPIAIL